MKASDKRLGVLWIVLYVLFAIAPLTFMLVGERPMGRDLIREISVARECGISVRNAALPS